MNSYFETNCSHKLMTRALGAMRRNGRRAGRQTGDQKRSDKITITTLSSSTSTLHKTTARCPCCLHVPSTTKVSILTGSIDNRSHSHPPHHQPLRCPTSTHLINIRDKLVLYNLTIPLPILPILLLTTLFVTPLTMYE